MRENFRLKLRRWLYNFFPAFRATGGWMTHISDDMREIHVQLRLNWHTRNWVGTLYGGHLYSAVDGIPMVMLLHIMEPKYIVWDKSAEIRFLKPGKGTVRTIIRIPEEETQAIEQEVAEVGKSERIHEIEWRDDEGDVVATVKQVIHIRAKRKQ